jgi:hypothetical protein
LPQPVLSRKLSVLSLDTADSLISLSRGAMKEQGSSNEKTTPEQFLVLPLAFSFRDSCISLCLFRGIARGTELLLVHRGYFGPEKL